MINYSLIIPHRNTPELLQRCLDSIPHRQDLEIIIADDNSSISVVDFDNFPGNGRSDVKIILNKEGRGAGYCRNIAIDKAIGKWLLFSDSDDYFSDYLPILLDKYASDDDTDMVFLNAKAIDEFGKLSNLSINKYIDNFLKHKRKALDVLRFSFWSPWSRMVKRSVFIDNKISFEEVPVGNDTMGILSASRFSKSFAVESNVVYYYYKPTQGSQTKAAYSDKTYYQRLEQKLKVNQFYKEVDYPYYWPIARAFRDKHLNKTDTYRQIILKWEYKKAADFLATINYFIAKILKII